MNKKIKSVVLLVSFAAGLISGDAVFASSSLEKSKMLIGRGKKNLADAVDKNDVNCDEQLYLPENKAAKKSKNVSNKITKSSRFGPLEILGINGAAVGIGTAGFGIKKLVKRLQKHRHRGMEKDEENVKEQGEKNSKPHSNPKSDSGQVNPTTVKEKPHKNSNLPSNPKPDSGQENSTTVKEKPHGNISLWIKENPKVFSLIVTLFLIPLIICFRKAIKEIILLREIKYIGKFVKNMHLLKNLKNYKAILKKILIGNTDKILTLNLSDSSKLSSDERMTTMMAFYSLAGRFYDALGGFWCASYVEEDIENNLYKIDSRILYPQNYKKICLSFLSINDYLTKVRTNFDKIKDKKIDFNNFRKEEDLIYLYYYNQFAANIGIPDKECEKKLKSDIFNNHKKEGENKEDFFSSSLGSFCAGNFYNFLTNKFFCYALDDRYERGQKIRIEFLKYAIEKLIKDKDKKYNLTEENKTFLKYRLNAFLLHIKLLDAYYEKYKNEKGKDADSKINIINKKGLYYSVLNWCKENIKSKDLVKGDNIFKNEIIFFLARMETAYLFSNSDDIDQTAEGLFKEILDIYEGSNNNINNIINIFNDNNNNSIDYLKDANVKFEQIQFMN